jgi:hypothetical protein
MNMPKIRPCPYTHVHAAHQRCPGFPTVAPRDQVDGLLDLLTDEVEKRVRREIGTSLRAWAKEHGQSRGEEWPEAVAEELAIAVEKGEL